MLGRDDGAALASELRTAGLVGRIVSLSAAIGDTSSNHDPFDAAWTKPISHTGLLETLTDLLARGRCVRPPL